MQLDLDQAGLGLLGEENKKDSGSVEMISSPNIDSQSLPTSNNNCNHNKMNGYHPSNNNKSNDSVTTKTTTTESSHSHISSQLNTLDNNTTVQKSSSVSVSSNSSTENSVNSVHQRIVKSVLEDTSDLIPREIQANGGVVDGYLAREDNVSGLEGPSGPRKLVWRNIIIFAYLHMAVAYGAFLVLTGSIMWQTMLFSTVLHFLGGMGITAGAHRCWSHKAYKARTPLKIILTFMQTLAFQNSVWEWVRDHRVHHKYAETNADPHNAKRGFFFAHIGWLLCRKHELVRVKGKQIDMSDIESDPILAFQKKYHTALGLFVCFVLPAFVPNYLWGESKFNGFLIAGICRYAFTLHITWLVNSAAHMFGNKPYDKSINPAENKTVAFWAFGEGWHNYHHVFPWDYKTAELGHYQFNLTTAFVDFFAWVGWAYDLKTVPKNVVMQRVKRTGDGTHDSHHHHENSPSHWGDKDIPAEDAKVTITLNKKD